MYKGMYLELLSVGNYLKKEDCITFTEELIHINIDRGYTYKDLVNKVQEIKSLFTQECKKSAIQNWVDLKLQMEKSDLDIIITKEDCYANFNLYTM